MNKVVLIGNLSRDPETTTLQNGKHVCKFTVACNRKIANAQGVREADFINCVAWERLADLVQQYFQKGKKIALEGHLQTGNYTAKDGSKRFTTDVVVESVEFIEKRWDTAQNECQTAQMASQAPTVQSVGFQQVEEGELPF